MTRKEQNAWNKFWMTGSVADYLNYKNAVREKSQTDTDAEGEQTQGADLNEWFDSQTKEFR